MQHLVLSGTFEQMGRAFGEACRDQISGLYHARVANAVEQAQTYGGHAITEADVRTIATKCLPIVRSYAPNGFAELKGIAAGANLELDQIWAMNALTDLRDIASWGDPASWGGAPEGEGCSSFIVSPDRAADGAALVGQTWDLATDNLPYVVLCTRKPAEGPTTKTLTTVGCLSLIGMNDAGVAIGTTNIRTLDSRLGVGYLDVIHAVLETKTVDQAIERVTSAPRAGAHYFYVMDRTGNAAAIECTAQQAQVQRVESGVFVHCNHVLEEGNRAMEASGTPTASTYHRQSRMEQLLASGVSLTPNHMFTHLADHDGEPNSICRHDFAGITSNASVVMSPTEGRMWAVHGPACQGTWALVD